MTKVKIKYNKKYLIIKYKQNNIIIIIEIPIEWKYERC